ncbi:hypothetical protein ACFFK0_04105 [Paenibacillus chartarius]|uniref:Uncharacterized protein n=1 Tax=Paenibacillus chartarius TaxID=747481 RepID=A0ABV6DG83_9BACL
MTLRSRLTSVFRPKAQQPDASAVYEARIRELELQLSELKAAHERQQAPWYPVHIDHLHIEHAVIENVNYNNHIGSLDVDELTGKLNIGANYFGPIPEKVFESMTGTGKNAAKPNGTTVKMNGKPLEQPPPDNDEQSSRPQR